MTIYSMVLTFVFSLSFLLMSKNNLLGTFLFVGTLAVLAPYKYFYYSKEKAKLSLMTYSAIQGNNLSYESAEKQLKKRGGSLTYVSFVDLFVKNLGTKHRKGPIEMIRNFLLSSVKEIIPMLSRFMLPAVVVENRSLNSLVYKIDSLNRNVSKELILPLKRKHPIEIAKKFLVFFNIGMLIFSFIVGFLFAEFGAGGIFRFLGSQFSWYPIFMLMFISATLTGISMRVLDSLAVIYFTVMYAMINKSKEVDKRMAMDLMVYLRLEEWVLTKKKPLEKEKFQQKIRSYYELCKKRGFKEDQITKHLVANGYKKKDLIEVLK